MAGVRKILRSAQVHFPSLLEFRYAAQRAYLRARKKPADFDFNYLRYLKLKPDQVMVDIGANRGQSIDAMRIFHPNQPIVAFEPNLALAVRLEEMFAHDSNLKIENFGLGERSEELHLNIPNYNGWDFDGQAALVFNPEQLEYLQTSFIGFDPAKLTFKKMSCEIRRFDNFNLAPGFIKIDTEGYELNVIRGATETLRRHRPALMIENSFPEEMAELLAPFGYSPFNVTDDGLKPGRGMRNTIYVAS